MAVAFITGLLVGIIVGALGAGGGILSVPILVYILHQDPHDAAAASLVIVGITALVALPGRARQGHVRWRDGAIFGALSMLGSVLGGLASRLVSPAILMVLFAGLLLCVGVLMVRSAWVARRVAHYLDDDAAAGTQGLSARFDQGAGAQADQRPGAQPGQAPARPEAEQDDTALPSSNWRRLLLLVAAATVTGLLTGFFGVGGGFAVVPMLVLVMHFGMKEASGTSLLVMIIASLAGLASRYGSSVSIDWPVVLFFTAGSAVGGILGGPVARRAPSWVLTACFAALLIGVAVAVAVEAIPPLLAG